MSLDRRALLGALGVAAAGAGTAAYAQAQTSPPATQPSLTERLTARARENRVRINYANGRFSGAGWDKLVEEGRVSQFFCIGEEHGIAENPKLAAQLFTALASSGYRHACVEISPPMAGELDAAAARGVDAVRALVANPNSRLAFFGMREEAEWAAVARAAVRERGPVIWGLDYEVGSDRRLIARLKAKRKPAAAEAALTTLEAASNASWAQYEATHSPQHIYSFAGDPALVRAVRDNWLSPDADAALILETLEETFAINQLWVQGQGWRSNERRAQFNRRNLRRYWAEEKAHGHAPRVMFKFGSSHMVRGVSYTQSHDIGTQIAEIAEAEGGKSFHLMVLPGAGAQHAAMDPTSFTYRPTADTYYDIGLEPLLAAVHPDAMTLIDLRPLRPLVFGARHKALDADLVRTIHGFDALLVMTGSTPSANL